MRIIVVLVTLVLISCGGGESAESDVVEETAGGDTTAVDDADSPDTADTTAMDYVADTVETQPDSVINVTVGEDFTIDLDANPTTGYHWELVRIDQPESIVQQAGDPEYAQDEHAEGMVGVGGTETWYFHSSAEGNAVIEFGYYAPGADSTDAPRRVVTFSVIVI
jgi:predicted secreted protein